MKCLIQDFYLYMIVIIIFCQLTGQQFLFDIETGFFFTVVISSILQFTSLHY